MYQNIRERKKKVAALCGYQFLNFEKKSKVLQTKILKHFIPWGWAGVKIGKILEKIHFKL